MTGPFVFGCVFGDSSGHRLCGPGLRSTGRFNSVGPFDRVDAELAPLTPIGERRRAEGRMVGSEHELPQGHTAVHHKDGWTALAFWDRSGDSRPNSNTTFFFAEVLDFDAALSAAREAFPTLFERFEKHGLEIVPAEGGET